MFFEETDLRLRTERRARHSIPSRSAISLAFKIFPATKAPIESVLVPGGTRRFVFVMRVQAAEIIAETFAVEVVKTNA